MNPEPDLLAAIHRCWAGESGEPGDADYSLSIEIDGGFVGRTRAGLPAVVIPVKDAGLVPFGRRTAGCELIGHRSTRLVFQGRDTVSPAAALLCTDPELVDSFAILAVDVAKRVRAGGASWSSMVAAVEEWQSLLAPRGRPSAEVETGLWGELWFISEANDIDTMLAGWRGPEGDATDFFVGRKGAEVKTSRFHRLHHVSQAQVDTPVGDHDAWLLSIWVKVDPSASATVAQLADRVLDRASDRADALRRLARAGYSPAERSGYTASFIVLTEPEWYAAKNVPRVRLADPGVSQLRYRVALDESNCADRQLADSLWRHFHGRAYEGEQR